VTNNPDLDRKIRMLRDHGQERKYHHELVGWNGRMDGLQGSILSVKLKYLNGWNELRRGNARRYNELLRTIDGVVIPVESPDCKHVYEKDIQCGIHYPMPLYMQDAYKAMDLGAGSFPVAEKVASEVVSLPMFPELSSDQIFFVAAEIKKLIYEKTPG
jgi:dTDP-4-amino-4,6-dideoxygalactose transaminase